MLASDQTQVRVGGVVLFALIASVFYAVVLGNQHAGATMSIRVHFGHMAGLSEGTDVHLAGQLVGRLVSLELVPKSSVPENHYLFPEGGVTAHLLIDNEYANRARINGDYFVGSKGLFGKQYIEIGPPLDAPPARAIRDGDELRGIDPPILDRAVYNAMRNFEAFRGFVAEVEPELTELTTAVDELDGHLGEVLPDSQTWDHLVEDSRSSSSQLRSLIDELGGLSELDRILTRSRRLQSSALDSARVLKGDFDILSRDLERIGAASPAKLTGRFRTALARFEQSSSQLEKTLASAQELALMLERGEGTAGALLNDPEFSDDARRLGKILKRTPWRIFGKPGNRKPKFGKPPEPIDL